MSRAIPAGLKIASRRRRLGACFVDLVVLIPPGLAVGGGGVALYVWRRRRDGRELELDPARVSTRWKAVIWVGFEVVRLPARNWRSPGYRAMGLRRVEVRTGEPLSVRNALVSDLVALAAGQLRQRLTKPWVTRIRGRLKAQRSELREVERAHPDGSAAQQEAVKAHRESHHVNLVESCAPALLGLAVQQAPALWSPLNQTLTERLAGTIVVQD